MTPSYGTPKLTVMGLMTGYLEMSAICACSCFAFVLFRDGDNGCSLREAEVDTVDRDCAGGWRGP
jgi:hypothetical protein